MGYQVDSGVFGDPQLNTSILYFLITLTLGEIFRYLVREMYSDPMMTERILLHEIVATFEKVACVYELQIIMTGYGKMWYYTAFFIVTMWLNYRKDPTKSSVIWHIENLTTGRRDLIQAIVQTGIEMIVGFIIYPAYIRPLWRLAEVHPARQFRLAGCGTDLKTTTAYGFWLEFSGSFVLQLVPMILSTMIDSGLLLSSMNTLLLVYIVHLGIDDAGAWYSPTLATIFQTGCSDVFVISHFIVYWLSAIVGTALAYFSYRYARQLLGWDTQRKDD